MTTAKIVIYPILVFLVFSGCLFIYNRETVMIQNQTVLKLKLEEHDQSLRNLSGIINNNAKIVQKMWLLNESKNKVKK